MLEIFTNSETTKTIPVSLLTKRSFKDWQKSQPASTISWLKDMEFDASPGQLCIVSSDGKLTQVVAGFKERAELWDYASLSARLPYGEYRIDAELESPLETVMASVGWGLGTYSFSRYKSGLDKKPKKPPVLLLPDQGYQDGIQGVIKASFLAQDLVNTPASDMGPEELAKAGEKLAKEHGASCNVIVGDQLIEQNYPLIHAVGRASSRAPRLIDIKWRENAKAPLLTLVGKGVVFDSGGLNIKSTGGMITMKGDMGGAAHALGLAGLIMETNLNVRLRVLIPAVENSISANAYRPSDIITSRKGLTVEVGNTDAEGRLVLADALAEASSENPDMIIDFATLTGAGIIATGPDIPVIIGNDDKVCQDLMRCSREVEDLVWQLPLHMGYRSIMDSPIADLHSIGTSDIGGGAITAALFLNEFVDEKIAWVHMDFCVLKYIDRLGRPKGAQTSGIRASFRYLEERYGFQGLSK